MPCYSNVTTKLTDFAEVERAARKVYGDAAIKIYNSYNGRDVYIRAGGVGIYVSEPAGYQDGDGLTTSAQSAAELAVLKAVAREYADQRVQRFAKKFGYTVNRNPKNRNELNLTSIR